MPKTGTYCHRELLYEINYCRNCKLSSYPPFFLIYLNRLFSLDATIIEIYGTNYACCSETYREFWEPSGVQCIITSMSSSMMRVVGPLPLIPAARLLRLLGVYSDRLNAIICHPPVASGQLCSPLQSLSSLNPLPNFPCYLMHLLNLTHTALFPLISPFLITIWLETSISPSISTPFKPLPFPYFPW